MLTLLLGTIGVGGLGAAALLFFPGLLPVAIAAVAAILRCKICLVALALVATFIFADVRRHNIEVAKCRAADIAMQLRAAQRDAAIAADKQKFAEEQMRELEAAKVDSDKKVADYEEVLRTVKTGSCPLGPDAAGRVRDILHR